MDFSIDKCIIYWNFIFIGLTLCDYWDNRSRIWVDRIWFRYSLCKLYTVAKHGLRSLTDLFFLLLSNTFYFIIQE